MKAVKIIETKFKAGCIAGLTLLCIAISPFIAGAQSVITTYAGGSPIQLSSSLSITQIGIGSPVFRSFGRSGWVLLHNLAKDIPGCGQWFTDADCGQWNHELQRRRRPSGFCRPQLSNGYRTRWNRKSVYRRFTTGSVKLPWPASSPPSPVRESPALRETAVRQFRPKLRPVQHRGGSGRQSVYRRIQPHPQSYPRRHHYHRRRQRNVWLQRRWRSCNFGPFRTRRSIAVDRDGSLFIADYGRIRKVTTAGIITTVAGNGTDGFSGDGGPATSAQLYQFPSGITVDQDGNLFIGDNGRIRKVTPAGIITTVAGNGTDGFSGDGGPAVSAQLGNYCPCRIGSGRQSLHRGYEQQPHSRDHVRRRNHHCGRQWITCWRWQPGNFRPISEPEQCCRGSGRHPADCRQLSQSPRQGQCVRDCHYRGGQRTYDTTKTMETVVWRSPPASSIQPVLRSTLPATCTSLQASSDGSGEGLIRKINTAGIINTISRRLVFLRLRRLCTSSEKSVWLESLWMPMAMSLLPTTFGQNIWKISPSGNKTLVAGSDVGKSGYSGDGGPATSALLSFPNGLAVDGDGNLFIADSNNNRIRKVTPAGIISTVAGNGVAGFGGDGGPATSAQLRYPLGVAVDGSGNLFIADAHNNRIRKVSPAGIITTVAGDGTAGFGGDGGPADAAQLNYPTSVAIDGMGNLFIADYYNNRVRKVSFGTTLALTSISPGSGGQGKVVQATLSGFHFDSTLSIRPIDGITVSDLTLVSSTSATATFTIAAAAVAGVRDVVVTTSTGTNSCNVCSEPTTIHHIAGSSGRRPGHQRPGEIGR